MVKKKLGEILVEAGLITSSTVNEALSLKREDQKIGDYLVEKGYVREEMMYEKLSDQLKIPLFRLTEVDIKQNALDSVSKEILFKYNVFPVELSGSLLTLAMENPMDDDVIKEIEDVIQLDISGVFGLKSEILDYISKYYEIDESMTEIFGMTDNSNSDRNELQIADTFFNYLKANNKLNIVIVETRGILKVKLGEANLTSKKDTRYLVDFIKKMIGYDESSDKFNVLLNQGDNKVRLSMKVNRNKSQIEYWIEAFLITLEEDKEVYGLEDYTEHGIYVLLNKTFNNTETLKNQLQSLQLYNNKTVLVNTNDITFEKSGVTVLEVPYEETVEYINFGDIFVYDYGWEIDNIVPLLRVLREGKTVYLHTPFGNQEEFINYARKLQIYDTIENFIRGYKSI